VRRRSVGGGAVEEERWRRSGGRVGSLAAKYS